FSIHPTSTITIYTLSLHDALPIFTPTQLIVAPDGTAAYALGETSPSTGQFPFIIQFNIQNQTSSLLTLGNGAIPLSASLSPIGRSEEHTSELQSLRHLVCRLLLEK